MPELLRTRRALAAALIIAVGISGCGTWLEGAADNRCATDDDCAGARCDADLGMCVATTPPAMQVAFVVVPATDPLGGTPLPVTFGPADVTPERDLELPLAVTVRGQVRDVGGEPVSASVTFTLLSTLPGVASTRVESQTFTAPVRDGSDVFDYAVQLLPDAEYDVVVQPTGDWRSRLPPLRERFTAPSAGTHDKSFSWSDLVTIRGTVVDRAGYGQPGMLIRAIEPATGRVLSSVYTTGTNPDLAPGWFEIQLDRSTASYFLSLNASSSRIEAGRPSPTFTVDPSTLFDTGSGVTILLPPISDQVITYSGSVEPADSPGHGTAATLTFISSDVTDQTTGVIGTFRAMVATDESNAGAFTVQLLPGTYDVVVTPTSSDLGRELGILRESSIHLGAEHTTVMGTVFALPRRSHYGATVQTPDARAVANAQVHARPRGSTLDGTLPDVAIYARSTDAMTDPDGRFDLPLDIGLYDLTIEPPAGTNWPWAVRPIPIGGTDTVMNERVPLSPPVPMTGHVSFAGGPPVANGEVRAYALVDDDGSQRAVQIGRAQTDGDGAFMLLLPSSL